MEDTPKGLFMRGFLEYLGRNYREAIWYYDKAIELDPNDSRFYNNRGAAKERLGMFAEAMKDYSKAIELDPSDERFASNLRRLELKVQEIK